MLKLTFKNVGHGDSIIIEWLESGNSKIAIIDSNIYNGRNPVLDYLIDNKYKKIEYLILSHPHYDHFSGIKEILEFFSDNDYRINYFLHTAQQVPDFIKMALSSAIAEKELQELFLSLRRLSSKLEMKVGVVHYDLPNNTIPLGSNYSLTILSPSFEEFDKYAKNISVFQNEENGVNNPNANWLSTVLSINIKDSYILLTSDCEKYSLIRIDKKTGQGLNNQLILGQSPHHGSKSNHNNAFWKKRNRVKPTPIVFSTGPNNYNHPSLEAVNFFVKNNFDLFSTNNIGGLLKVEEKSIKGETIRLLDMFSMIDDDENTMFTGDKTFKFDNSESNVILTNQK